MTDNPIFNFTFELSTIVSFEVLYATMFIPHINFYPLFSPHDTSTGMTITDIEMTIKYDWIDSSVHLIIYILEVQFFCRFCWFCWFSSVFFFKIYNHFNIIFKLLFIMHQSSSSVQFFRVIKRLYIIASQFWCTLAKTFENSR